MHIKSLVTRNLDYAAGDIRAVVGNTLKVVEKVRKNKSMLYRTLALLKSENMIELDLITEVVNYLLKGLNVGSELQIVIYKSSIGDIENLGYRALKHTELMVCLIGERNLLFLDLLYRLDDVDSVVGNTLQVTDKVKKLGVCR